MQPQITRLQYLFKTITPMLGEQRENWASYPCLEWPHYINHNGYGWIHTGVSQGVFVHRAALERSGVMLSDEKPFALHHCDNRRCFRPVHLFPGTHADNIHDCISKGRSRAREPRPLIAGILNPRAKLSVDQVNELRAKHAKGGITMKDLGKEYAISGLHAKRIVTRQSWK